MKKTKTKKIMNKMKWISSLIAIFLLIKTHGQEKIVSGMITDSESQPIPGVAVIKKGTNKGTVSDFDGNYEIEAKVGDILTFRFIGFETQSFVVGESNNIDITLDQDYANLEEVVITGYGTTRKKDLVSSISQIKGDELSNIPAASVDNLLQGRAAGVNVVSSGGRPGDAANIQIRGVSSISGNNKPLIVIDDFIVGTDFNLSNLNVNDIRSVEVLKDASSLAIYGTRGAAGVILIQTKNGLSVGEGNVNVSINHYTSMDKIVDMPEMADQALWAEFWSEGMSFISGADGYGDNDPNYVFPYTLGTPTDWRGLISRDGKINNTDINISGNSGKTNYFISLNRFDQEGVIKGSGLLRNTLRANLDVKVNDKVRTGIRFSLADRKIEDEKLNWDQVYMRVAAIRPIYNSNGLYDAFNPVSGSLERNPVADLNERIDHTFSTNLITSAYAEYDPIPGLTLRTSVGINLDFVKENQYLPSILPIRREQGIGGRAQLNSRNKKSVLNENTLTYSKEIGDHSIKVLAGFTLQKNTSTLVGATGEGYPNDVVTFNNLALGADPLKHQIRSNYLQRTFTSVLGRINYGYQGKYLLTLVARRDGSSVFEEGNKYAIFPSAGVAWNISEENFMESFDVISNLKLRASYGIVGEQGVVPYNSFAKFTDLPVYLNDVLNNSVVLDVLPSKGLEWEKTNQMDIGLEIGFLNNRYTLEFDYYNKQTKDLLLAKPLPGTAGSTRLENIGEVENKGFEISISSLNIDNSDFTWRTTLNIAANKNKVLSLGGQGEDFIALDDVTHPAGGDGLRVSVGSPIPSFWGLNYLGTYKTRAEIDADGRFGQSFLGGPRFQDTDGSGVLNDIDFVNLGSPDPEFFGGLMNTINYKNFKLDIYIHGSLGNEIYNGSVHEHFFARGPEFGVLQGASERWTVSNPNSDIPRAGTSQGLYVPTNSVMIQDGSFLRLKNVTLTYLINQSLFEKASVYVSGTNLLLLTSYDWGDPETSNYGSGALNQGVSNAPYPYATSVALGLNLTL